MCRHGFLPASPFSQLTIFPSVMVDDSAGMWISFTSAFVTTDRAAARAGLPPASADERLPAEKADRLLARLATGVASIA